MDLTYYFFIGLAGLVIPALGVIVLRTYLKKEPYEFEMVFMKPGIDEHTKIRGSSLEFETPEIGEKKYKIKADRLYRVKPGQIGKLVKWIKGISGSFIAVYQDGETDPIETPSVKISARILKEVQNSRALGSALKSEFKVPMDLKKILLIVGVVIIGAVVYILMSGEIAL